MNIYCETNFILEVVFAQEQAESCRKIIEICQNGKANLIIPTYSFAESLYKLETKRKEISKLREMLVLENTQFARNTQYLQEVQIISELERFLVKVEAENKVKLEDIWQSLAQIAEIINFDAKTFQNAKSIESRFSFRNLHDAIIFASILDHINQQKPEKSCFLNRNSRDFDTVDVINHLKSLNCKFFSDFQKACNYIESQTQ